MAEEINNKSKMHGINYSILESIGGTDVLDPQ